MQTVSLLLFAAPFLSPQDPGVAWFKPIPLTSRRRSGHCAPGPGDSGSPGASGGPDQPGGSRPDRPGPATTGGGRGSGGAPPPRLSPPPGESGPGITTPPGVGPTASLPGLSGLGFEQDLGGWERWWRFNRESLLPGEGPHVGPHSPVRVGEAGQEARGIPRALVHARVVPRLLRVLDERPSSQLRAAVLLSLARIGEPQAGSKESRLQKLFVEHLAQGKHVAESACIALGVLGQPSSAPILRDILGDHEEARRLVGGRALTLRERAFAAYGLGLLGESADNPHVRRFATHALVSALESAPRATPDVRVAIVLGLGVIPGDARGESGAGGCPCESNDVLSQRLLALFEERRAQDAVRAHVPSTLAALAPQLSAEARDRVVRTLLAAMQSRREDRLVRQGCALALGRIGDADLDTRDVQIRRALRKLVMSARADLRHCAAIALAQVASRPGCGRGDSWAGTEEIERFLGARLARAKFLDRTWLALSLGLFERGCRDHHRAPSTELATALRQALQAAKSPQLVSAYAIACGLARDADAIAGLSGRLAKVHGPQKGLVALGLGLTEDGRAIPELRAALADAGHEAATCEGATLGLLAAGDAQRVPELKRVLEACECLRTRVVGARALGRTRDARAVTPLLVLLGDRRTPDVQRTAVVFALGRLAEKEALPWNARLSTGVNYFASPPTLTSSVGAGILDVP